MYKPLKKGLIYTLVMGSFLLGPKAHTQETDTIPILGVIPGVLKGAASAVYHTVVTGVLGIDEDGQKIPILNTVSGARTGAVKFLEDTGYGFIGKDTGYGITAEGIGNDKIEENPLAELGVDLAVAGGVGAAIGYNGFGQHIQDAWEGAAIGVGAEGLNKSLEKLVE